MLFTLVKIPFALRLSKGFGCKAGGSTATGKVIGIMNMVFVKGTKENAITNPSGIAYAIPASYIQGILKK